jgi:hypothetical protein
MSQSEWERLMDRLLTGHYHQIREAADKARRAQEEKHRKEEAQRIEWRDRLNQAVWRIIGNVAPDESARFRESNWRRTQLPGYGATPDSIIDSLNFWEFERLMRELGDIIRMVTGDGFTAEHLGLPVGRVYLERAEERERQNQQNRSTRLMAALSNLLRVDDAWLNGPSSDLDGAVPALLAKECDDACARVIAGARKENQRRADKVERAGMAEEYRARLRDDASRSFVDEDRAALWLRGTNQRLDRRRPVDYCEDAATYARCQEVLAEQSAYRNR